MNDLDRLLDWLNRHVTPPSRRQRYSPILVFLFLLAVSFVIVVLVKR